MNFAEPGQWFQWEPDGPGMVVSCNTCRCMAFTDDPVHATELIIDHARQCTGADVLILEAIEAA